MDASSQRPQGRTGASSAHLKYLRTRRFKSIELTVLGAFPRAGATRLDPGTGALIPVAGPSKIRPFHLQYILSSQWPDSKLDAERLTWQPSEREGLQGRIEPQWNCGLRDGLTCDGAAVVTCRSSECTRPRTQLQPLVGERQAR